MVNRTVEGGQVVERCGVRRVVGQGYYLGTGGLPCARNGGGDTSLKRHFAIDKGCGLQGSEPAWERAVRVVIRAQVWSVVEEGRLGRHPPAVHELTVEAVERRGGCQESFITTTDSAWIWCSHALLARSIANLRGTGACFSRGELLRRPAGRQRADQRLAASSVPRRFKPRSHQAPRGGVVKLSQRTCGPLTCARYRVPPLNRSRRGASQPRSPCCGGRATLLPSCGF